MLNKALFISSVSFSNENICENETMDYIINNDPRNTEYNETRNDAGIHFDFDCQSMECSWVSKFPCGVASASKVDSH